MYVNTKTAAQSKVTDKQIEDAMKEATQGIKTYGGTMRALIVIRDLLALEYGKKLTKRFTDKVKAALPNESISIMYPYEGQMVIQLGYNAPKVTVTDRKNVPDYTPGNYGKTVDETKESELQKYIDSYAITVKNYEQDVQNLPTFAAAYNAKIQQVMDIMEEVPALHCDLGYRLPLMYFRGKA
jgi:hypothetical protein